MEVKLPIVRLKVEGLRLSKREKEHEIGRT